jgi:hypothetical protein
VVLGELRSKALPRAASRPRRFQPRAEHVAWPLTPSVATAPFEPDLSVWPALTAARIHLDRCLVKGNRLAGTRTPSIVESPRRLLQSVQLMSTTTNHPIPRAALANVARSARAEPTGLGPHPPRRPLVLGDPGASTLACLSRGVLSTSSRFQPERPEIREICSLLSKLKREGFAPNPTRPGTSRHGTAAASAGDRHRYPRRRSDRSQAVAASSRWLERSRHTSACRACARGPPLRSARAKREERHSRPRAASPVAPRRAASQAAP